MITRNADDDDEIKPNLPEDKWRDVKDWSDDEWFEWNDDGVDCCCWWKLSVFNGTNFRLLFIGFVVVVNFFMATEEQNKKRSQTKQNKICYNFSDEQRYFVIDVKDL